MKISWLGIAWSCWKRHGHRLITEGNKFIPQFTPIAGPVDYPVCADPLVDPLVLCFFAHCFYSGRDIFDQLESLIASLTQYNSRVVSIVANPGWIANIPSDEIRLYWPAQVKTQRLNGCFKYCLLSRAALRLDILEIVSRYQFSNIWSIALPFNLLPLTLLCNLYRSLSSAFTKNHC